MRASVEQQLSSTDLFDHQLKWVKALPLTLECFSSEGKKKNKETRQQENCFSNYSYSTVLTEKNEEVINTAVWGLVTNSSHKCFNRKLSFHKTKLSSWVNYLFTRKKNRNWIGKEKSSFFPWKMAGGGVRRCLLCLWPSQKWVFYGQTGLGHTAEERGNYLLSDLPIFPSTSPELQRWAFSLKADPAVA